MKMETKSSKKKLCFINLSTRNKFNIPFPLLKWTIFQKYLGKYSMYLVILRHGKEEVVGCYLPTELLYYKGTYAHQQQHS